MSAVRINHELVLVTMDCCSCAVVYAMPEYLQERAKRDGNTFYCPNGHPQSYTKSENDRLREKLDEQTRVATREAQRAANTELIAQTAEAETTKIKRKLKTIEKRVHAGVCPCCNRTFQNLARHMATKHKDVSN